jgi:hypothetical protein
VRGGDTRYLVDRMMWTFAALYVGIGIGILVTTVVTKQTPPEAPDHSECRQQYNVMRDQLNRQIAMKEVEIQRLLKENG